KARKATMKAKSYEESRKETPKWTASTTKEAPKWKIPATKDTEMDTPATKSNTEIDDNKTLKKKLTSNTSE
ncbi:2257_t:CDS:1, partial [Gigaspora margarita]